MARLLNSSCSVLRASGYRFIPDACKEAAAVLLGLLRKHLPDRADALGRIQDAFAAGEILPEDLVSHAFRDQSEEILAAAQKVKADEDLFAGISVFLARPFRAQAARDLLRDVDLGQWLRGHCPVCGHWPVLAHVQSAEGRRTLWCLHCGTHWPFGRLQCPYCLNENQEELDLIGVEAEPSSWAHTCAGCGKYIKEIRTGQSVDAFPFEEFYLETHASDLLARDAGFAPEGLLAAAVRSPGDGRGHLSFRARAAGVRDEADPEARGSGEL